MRFDINNLILELILTLVALIWWLKRTPNTQINCKRKQQPASYIIWPGIGPSFNNINFPLESLLVNIASLSGTILSDILRPSQAIFSVCLVLHDAWPLLFNSVTTSSNNISNGNNNNNAESTNNNNNTAYHHHYMQLVPNRRNWMRFLYVCSIFLVLYFIADVVVEWLWIIHQGAVICGYLAGVGAAIVGARHLVDYQKQVDFHQKQQERIFSNETSLSASPLLASPRNLRDNIIGKDENNSTNSSAATSTPPPHDILESAAVASTSGGNPMQHWALIATYWVYAVMLLVDFSSWSESGPWLLYCTGSVFVEVVKSFWLYRMKSMNVDTVV